MRALCSLMSEGVAAILISQEALADRAYGELRGALALEPPWSDPPVLLISERVADSALVTEAMNSLGNVTVLERPTPVPTLVSAVNSALRSRNRQYQIRSYIEEHERYAEALRAADRRKDVFLATLAHELRNPLAPMRTALEVMRIAPPATPPWSHAQAVVERQLKQMARLIDDLLDLSRISRGQLELRREHVNLKSIIDTALEISRPAIEALGHTLLVELPREPIALCADATRLAQVFSNLLNNAAKYTDRGGRIELAVGHEDREIVVRVRDNGIGIERENLRRVFDMFTQVGRSLEQSRGGLGVGLALSQWLIQLHEGSIEARSEGLGRGSEFVVRLPLAEHEAREREATLSGSASPSSMLRAR